MNSGWKALWQAALRLLPTKGIEALREAMENDSPELIQGNTTNPPPLKGCMDWPVESACLLGYCGWKGNNLKTVAEVEEYFGKICFEIDNEFDEPAACRYLLNMFDDAPRPEMIILLLPDLKTELERRLNV